MFFLSSGVKGLRPRVKFSWIRTSRLWNSPDVFAYVHPPAFAQEVVQQGADHSVQALLLSLWRLLHFFLQSGQVVFLQWSQWKRFVRPFPNWLTHRETVLDEACDGWRARFGTVRVSRQFYPRNVHTHKHTRTRNEAQITAKRLLAMRVKISHEPPTHTHYTRRKDTDFKQLVKCQSFAHARQDVAWHESERDSLFHGNCPRARTIHAHAGWTRSSKHSYQSLGHARQDVARLEPERDVLPRTVNAHARFLVSPRQVVVVRAVEHRVARRRVGRRHRLVELVAAVSWGEGKRQSYKLFAVITSEGEKGEEGGKKGEMGRMGRMGRRGRWGGWEEGGDGEGGKKGEMGRVFITFTSSIVG